MPDGRPEPEPDGVIDAGQFESLRQLGAGGGEVDLLERFVEQFLGQAASDVAQLRAAAARGDAAAARALAHGLKGTSATMGAAAMAAACEALEEATSGGAVSPDAVGRVARELERAATAMRARARS